LLFAESSIFRYCFGMSTLVEIQDAITKLRDDERSALATWLLSRGAPELSAEDEERLLRSLDEAIRDVDAGQGVPIGDVRQRVTSWAAK
jgi:hypothetical protein